MNLLAWIPHFRCEYLAIYKADCGCGDCKVAMHIPRHEVDDHPAVLQLSVFMAFGRPWRPKVTRIK